MSQFLAASELVLNPDGTVYHCNIGPEQLADTVFLVGDPGRVPVVSAFFDRIEFKTQKREIATHTGVKNGKMVTVVSTGMGTDNVDIVLSELDAAANIDLKEKKLRDQHRQLTFIRLGTSGSLQPEIPVDSFLASTHGLGFDGLLHYYEGGAPYADNDFVEHFIRETGWDARLPKPYLVDCDATLLEKAAGLSHFSGVTATATGFYGPQGRVLRMGVSQSDLNDKLSAFRHNGLRITNFEMETSGIYGLSRLMGHRALTINCIIANRFTGQYSKDYHKAMQQLIGQALETFL